MRNNIYVSERSGDDKSKSMRKAEGRDQNIDAISHARPHPESASTWSWLAPSCQAAKLPTCQSPKPSSSSSSNSNCNPSSSCSQRSATCSPFVFVVLIYSGTGFIYRRCFYLAPRPIASSSWAPCCVIHASGGWLPALWLSRCTTIPLAPALLGLCRFLIWQIYTHQVARCTLHSSSQLLLLLCCYYYYYCSQLVYYKCEQFQAAAGLSNTLASEITWKGKAIKFKYIIKTSNSRIYLFEFDL